MINVDTEVGRIMLRKQLSLGTVESATSGLIGFRITSVPGSSGYFKGSIISYSNEIKANVVGVRSESLERYGAVSSQVAEEMASGGKRLLNVDICISDTGIAGPDGGSINKPVGLFYLGLAHDQSVFNRRHIFTGDREQNRVQAAGAALEWLLEYLRTLE